jgi:2,3-diketo-5-methylthiopentyl-1-phosphate enolase
MRVQGNGRYTKLEYVVAVYRVEAQEAKLTSLAEGIAVGLTVGSWTDLPELRRTQVMEHAGRVEHISVLRRLGDGLAIAEISIGYPVVNFTPVVASILTTVFGKLSMDGRIRLVELSIPEQLQRQFRGPSFGSLGLREQVGITSRPLVMSIFKSCIGQSLADLTENFRAQALGKVDFVKDDEIFFDESNATPEQRVQAFRRAAMEVFEDTGVRTHYAVHLSGPVSGLLARARRLVNLGADALLFNGFAYGLDVLREIAEDRYVCVPIFAHPAVSGAMYASVDTGISAHILLGSLLRMAGADVVLYPSSYGSVTLAEDECARIVEALRRPAVHRAVMPAPSAGLHPGMLPNLYRDLGSDFLLAAGGGIHGHPDGITAGGLAFRAAIDALENGQSLSDAALQSEPLHRAIAKWGMVG